MPPLALYLHLPFCRRRCSYCDFNAYRDPGPEFQESYYQALLQDLEQEGKRGRPRVGTVFLGGGTPSLVPPDWIHRILEACHRAFRVDEGAEITMEANPGTLRPRALARIRAAGVNRLSFGVQALDDGLLRGLERVHSAAEARRAVEEAREAGFDNLNLDLMYGLPGQDLRAWESTVEQAMALAPEHLAVYALILEEGTPMEARVRRGDLELPDADAVAEMEALLRRTLRPRGYRQYEISNWSLPGRECRHNLVYWANGEYAGLGCGAVSYREGWRFRRLLHPVLYAAALRAGRSPVVEAERLGTEAAVKDTLILALRTRRGVDLRRAGRRHRVGAHRLARFFDTLPPGLVRRKGPRVRLTARGRDVANEVFVRLLETALTLPEPPVLPFLTVPSGEC